MANKNNNLAHTKWMCKYHIVFIPKYRRKIIYNGIQELQTMLATKDNLLEYRGRKYVVGQGRMSKQ